MSLREAEKALANLEELVRRKAPPSHYVARHVLLALAQATGEGDPGAPALLDRARAAGRAAGPAWSQAIQTELTLACGEFAQSVEPRYLSLPGYDLAYTRAARARLEDRLKVAGALGFVLTSRETELLALADRVLAEHLARRAQDHAGTHPPPGPERPPGRGAPERPRHKKNRK